MNDWIRYNNTGRVGQNGTVYSNSKIRELFDAVPLNN
jgi:hypothetical protein